MTGLLASVATLDEMAIARAGGADIVDLKEPSQGALGAWAIPALEAAAALWRSWPEPRPALSATIGDQPMDPETVAAAARRVAATGAPLVKLGIFAGGDASACLEALAPLARETHLIAVFFGDQAPDFGLLDEVAAYGFAGAMIDTADKRAGPLPRHLDDARMAAFVNDARSLGLLSGLAGSLTLDDAGRLAGLKPDYLGFRGALCEGGRTGRIDQRRIEQAAAAVKGRRDAA